MASEQLRVAIRIRPILTRNSSSNDGVNSFETETFELAAKQGQFDSIFDPSSSQKYVFSECGAPLLEAILVDGLDACMFCFGQTSSGKTFTMLGPEGGRATGRLDGVIPRMATELFRRISQLEADSPVLFRVTATFVEVYMNRALDLLPPATSSSASTPASSSSSPSSSSVSASSSVLTARPLVLRDAGSSSSASSSSSSASSRFALTGANVHRVQSTTELMRLVSVGSQTRATAATGMHDHSSRSHALLTLYMEKRWRNTKGEVMSRKSQLMLVDLAGSESMERAHDGNADRAGCAINVGLFVLGRVLDALASRSSLSSSSSSNAPFVPFRDSTLTRLLQPALQGNCRTCMLATISPSPDDRSETLATLRWAARARQISSRPVAAAEAVLKSDDWLGSAAETDTPDFDEVLDRRTIVISTKSFGEIYARCAGNPSDPLILYVHGSGPANSSLQWNFLVPQLKNERFYHVAIDCPGYGRSPGDRQSIRSYPDQLLNQVIRALAKTVAFCLIGSSQGACAVFNAALASPDISHYVAVMHPVGHDVKRYTAISQPALLAFDVEDDGHPVSVGRQMKRHLRSVHYFEFAASEQPRWVEDHFAAELVRMFSSYPRPRNAEGASSRLPDLTRPGGGLHSWAQAHVNEDSSLMVPLETQSASELEHSVASTFVPREETDDLHASSSSRICPDDRDVWISEFDAVSGKVAYIHTGTGERRYTRPSAGRIEASNEPTHTIQSANAPASVTANGLFVDGKDDDWDVTDSKEAEPVTEHERQRLEREQAEAEAAEMLARLERIECDRCHRTLVSPKVLDPCDHIYCAPCALTFGQQLRRCALCGSSIKRLSDADPELMDRLSVKLASGLMNAMEHENQFEMFQRAQTMSPPVLVLEFGNDCPLPGQEQASQRRPMTTFLRAAGKFNLRLIQRVVFDINPGTPNPGIIQTAPDVSTKQFRLERSMTRSFPCFITIHFVDALPLPPIQLMYYTQHSESTFVRRLAIWASKSVLTSAAASSGPAARRALVQRKKAGSFEIDTVEGDDIWINFSVLGMDGVVVFKNSSGQHCCNVAE